MVDSLHFQKGGKDITKHPIISNVTQWQTILFLTQYSAEIFAINKTHLKWLQYWALDLTI